MSFHGELLNKWLEYSKMHSGMNQTLLAEKSGISYTFISQVKNGARNPSHKTVQKLAESFGIATDVYLRGPDTIGETETHPAQKIITDYDSDILDQFSFLPRFSVTVSAGTGTRRSLSPLPRTCS